MLKYSVITFGCRVNQADSLGFEEQLRAAGASSDTPDRADLVIVNTCSVTASADQSARQIVRRIGRANPGARVVVTGCYATRCPDEFRGLPNVLRVVPNDDKPELIQLLTRDWIESSTVRLQPDLSRVRLHPSTSLGVALSTVEGQPDLSTAERFGDGDGNCGAAIEPGVAGRTAFTLRVQTGCAQPCAYCIIPTTRGRPRSVPIAGLLAEIDRVTGAGFKEIALTGVHLGSYGRDLNPASSLVELLSILAGHVPAAHVPLPHVPEVRVPAVRRVRLQPDLRLRISSLEPMDCTHEIVDLVAESDVLAPHFHLPLQHASNRMLGAMRRPYTGEYYAALVDRIRARIPSASIGSDVIVGFPGEREDDFEQLCEYLESSPLTHLHVFPYSDRPGTAALSMSGKVHGAVIRDRATRVREIGRRLTRKFHASQVGAVHQGLTLEDGTLVVTGNYLKVRIPPGRRRNEWVSVRVTGVTDGGITGETSL